VRVALVSARFPPQSCGVGDYTYHVAAALAHQGLEVHVVTSLGTLDETLYPLPASVRIHRVVGAWEVTCLPAVVALIRRIRPDALLIQYVPHSYDPRGVTFTVNVLPTVIRLAARVRVVTNFHELYMPFGPSLGHTAAAAWQRTMAVATAAGSHAITVTADEWLRRLRRMGVRRPVHVIPVGSNVPTAPLSVEDRGRLRVGLLGTEDGTLVGGFGAVHDREPTLVLDALAALKRDRPAKLVWIGGGGLHEPYRSNVHRAMRLHGLTEDDVVWTGVLPHTQVSRLLSSCDVVALAYSDGVSSRRGSAIAVLQHARPLLTTRGPAPDPRFVQGESVYLVPVGDREGFRDALRTLASDSALRERLARGGAALYRKDFTWDVIARRVAQVALDN